MVVQTNVEQAPRAVPRWRDLREWLELVKGQGQLREIRGATSEEDIGAITEMCEHTVGFEPGYRLDLTRKLRRALVLGALACLLAGVSCAPAAGPVVSTPAAQTAPPGGPPSAAPGGGEPATSAAAPSAPLASPVDLKVGSTLAISDGALFIAMEKGYLREKGVSVEIVRFASGTEMITSVSTGEIPVAHGGIGPGLFNAIGRGIGLRIVADGSVVTRGEDSSFLMAQKDLVDGGHLTGVADLRGKTVAMPPGVNFSYMLLSTALEQAGLTLDDVHVVGMGFPDVLPALGNGAVDVAYLPEPFVTFAIERTGAVRWLGASEVLPDHTVSAWLYSPHLINEQADVGRRFMVALVRGARDYTDAFWRNRGRPEAIAAILKHSTVKDPALYERMRFITIGTASGKVNLESLRFDLDWYRSRGYVREALDPAQMVDDSFAQYALQRLGPRR